MSGAAERRRQRAAWTTEVFRGPSALERMEDDALAEWAALGPLERLELTWELSLDQYGGHDVETVEPRLPRSAYRVERR